MREACLKRRGMRLGDGGRLTLIRLKVHTEHHRMRSRGQRNGEREDCVQAIMQAFELSASNDQSSEVAVYLLVLSKAIHTNDGTHLFYVSPMKVYNRV